MDSAFFGQIVPWKALCLSLYFAYVAFLESAIWKLSFSQIFFFSPNDKFVLMIDDENPCYRYWCVLSMEVIIILVMKKCNLLYIANSEVPYIPHVQVSSNFKVSASPWVHIKVSLNWYYMDKRGGLVCPLMSLPTRLSSPILLQCLHSQSLDWSNTQCQSFRSALPFFVFHCSQ